MKTLMTAIALAAVTVAGTASAMTVNTSSAQVAIERYAPNADISALSQTQVQALMNAIQSGDSNSERGGQVRALLRAYN